jgi:D-arabinose 1-dehydrogenase-like Zn-dependent alcohol dehydrogenase
MGGLGHMAVKYAKAFGAEVTVLSRSENKRAESLAMGADHFLISTSEDDMKVCGGGGEVCAGRQAGSQARGRPRRPPTAERP